MQPRGRLFGFGGTVARRLLQVGMAKKVINSYSGPGHSGSNSRYVRCSGGDDTCRALSIAETQQLRSTEPLYCEPLIELGLYESPLFSLRCQEFNRKMILVK
jgi:hypothetical protein